MKQVKHGLSASLIHLENRPAARRISTCTRCQVSTRGGGAKEIARGISDQTSKRILTLSLAIVETMEHGFFTGWTHLVDRTEKRATTSGCGAVEIPFGVPDYASNRTAAIFSVSEAVEDRQFIARAQPEEDSPTEHPSTGRAIKVTRHYQLDPA